MMTKRQTLTFTLLATLWIGGCVGADAEDPEVRAVQEALEADNGGFDAEDGEPMFGLEAEFAEAGLDAEDPPIEDPMLVHGPEGAAWAEGDGAAAINVMVLWGQLRPDLELEEGREWSGALEVTAGALVLRRAIRFEGPTDRILERPDHRTVAFTSVTRPHNDGLLVTLLPPRPAEGEVLPPEMEPALVIRMAGLDDVVIPAMDLADGFRALIPVDELGNALVITTAPAHPCPQGMLAGLWRHLRRDLGTFEGRWMGLGGDLQGHLRGIWGIDREGRRIFFGKYIGREGEFRGLLRGVWGEGRFTGVFVDRDGGYRGGLSGHFGDLESPLPGDGLFGGGWVESCEAERCGAEGECPGLDPTIPGADELP